LGQSAIIDWVTVTLAIGAGVALIRFKVNSAWLVLTGAVIGLARVILQ
jgi:chromate transporter